MFTPEQEAVLKDFADKELKFALYKAKLNELQLARQEAEKIVLPKYIGKVLTKLDAINIRTDISLDPEVARITTELEALK